MYNLEIELTIIVGDNLRNDNCMSYIYLYYIDSDFFCLLFAIVIFAGRK